MLYSYESAFAVRRLIQNQIKGDRALKITIRSKAR